MKREFNCFKAYDIRGEIGTQLTNEIVYDIGRAYCEVLKLNKIVIGADVRATSEQFKNAFTKGALAAGTDVIDLGMTGTEEIYFATSYLGVSGGVEITASHNPINYNGIKMVKSSSVPISSEDLLLIKIKAEKQDFKSVDKVGMLTSKSCLNEYVKHVISYIDPAKLKTLKVVVDPGNGAAGNVVSKLEKLMPAVEFIRVNFLPDPTFPNGIPNPLLPEMREITSNAVKKHGADLGIAWDGDFDRCFFFDENGDFIEGYYIVGLLAEVFLQKEAGAKIIHDPRLTWNTIDQVTSMGGVPVQSKTGHAFIKDSMRREDAVYGGEMSAHHYFRDFFYCDSGMIPWLLIVQLISTKGQSLSQLVASRVKLFPASGEINFVVKNSQIILEEIESIYQDDAIKVDKMDGLSFEFEQWRFNVRVSNTEPLMRLNVEARQNIDLMEEKTAELTRLIKNMDKNL